MQLAPLLAGVVVLAGCQGPAQAPARRSPPSSESLPAAVRAACDLVASVARSTRGVKVETATGAFRDERADMTRRGCSVSVAGSFAALEGAQDAVGAWREAFVRRGWREEPTYAADGPDGTAFAFVSGGVICLFRGEWDGGDDTDPAVPRDDAYRGWSACAAADSGP